jgi:hypothetical protein
MTRNGTVSRRSARALACFGAWALLLPAVAFADITITLDNSFIEKYKDRATIAANFTVAHAHPKPNPAAKDGDLHAAGTAPEIGLSTVAEIMNAKLSPKAVAALHGSESSGDPVAVEGVWRLWCEHGGDSEQVQGQDPPPPIDNTNPPHVFEIHPLTAVDDQRLASDFKPITGFKYKDADQAFLAYEKLASQITPGASQTTIRTTMGGYNYVEFVLELNEDPTHQLDDGLTVFASILNQAGELLVRNRRMVFVKDTAPFAKVGTLKKGDQLHVVGVPRISLSLLNWRIQNATARPEVLNWTLPYEIVVVAVLPK